MRRLSVFLLAMACLVVCQMASASRGVAEGRLPTLAPDEGLVVIGIETPERVGSLRFNRTDRYTDSGTIENIQPGTTMQVFVVRSGQYRWNDIDYYTKDWKWTFKMGKDPNFHFEVRPGIINYPGILIHRPHGSTASFHIVNRGMTAIDWLLKHNPELYQRYKFVYTGRYPDPFPDFYQAQREASHVTADARGEHTLKAPEPIRMPIPVRDLFRDKRIGQIGLSPDGSLLAEEILDDGHRHIDLLDFAAGTAKSILNVDGKVWSIDWSGNRDFAVTLKRGQSFGTVYFIRLREDGKQGRKIDAVAVPGFGRVIYLPPDDPAHVLFESDDSNGHTMVHQLDMNGTPSLFDFRLHSEFRIDRGVPDALNWLADSSGKLRAAWVRRGDTIQLLHGADGRFEKVYAYDAITSDSDDDQYLSSDGNTIYIVTDHGRAQRELTAINTVTHATTTVFSKAGVDIDKPVFDKGKHLLGVKYRANGSEVIEYFDPTIRNIVQRIGAAFPGAVVNIVERSESGKRFILSVEKSDQPLRLYQFDIDEARAALLEESTPWLDSQRLAPSQVVHASASDGVPIEAYLTLPVNAPGKVPLIVYSHGGPIGVRDELTYDPAVQLFASLGYAVLQVNYRGSDGYGRAFREAGKRQYGSLIEDDIDAATRTALKNYLLDEKRICAVGASYGGYSALMSGIRWPERIRCVVSISGVSDQMLMFTASDMASTESERKSLESVVGNPAADAQSMQSRSPLYRYKELTMPVMLVHGTDDTRVDYEHSRRLVRMLNLAGRPPVMLTLEGEDHGDFSEKNETALWIGVAGFLQAHLGAQAAPAH